MHTGFEFKNNAEKLRYKCSVDRKKENIIINLNWNRYEFNLDSYLRDLNLIFVYDEQNGYYRTSNIFEEFNETINKQLGIDSTYNPLKSKTITLSNYDINRRIFVDFFLTKKKENSYVIGSPEDLEKIPPQRRYLMPLIQTHGALILRNNANIYTATQNLSQKDKLIERNGKKNIN